MTVSGLLGLENGQHNFEFVLTSTYGTYKALASVVKEGGMPAAAQLLSPDDISQVEAMPVLFDWAMDANADSYHLEVASDITFTTIVVDEVLTTNSYNWSAIVDNGTYYWRVTSTNECGAGPVSGLYSFQLLLPLSVEEGEQAAFNMYPNPTASHITLSANSALGLVTICDLEGRVVKSINTTEITLNVDLSALAAGSYVINTNHGQQKLTVIK